MAPGAVQSPQITAGFVETTAYLGVVLLLCARGGVHDGGTAGPTCARAPAGLIAAVLNFTPGFAADLLLGLGPTAAVAPACGRPLAERGCSRRNLSPDSGDPCGNAARCRQLPV